jgi:hypothetical protein
MLVIRRAQIRTLEEAGRQRFEDEMAAHARASFAPLCGVLGEAASRGAVGAMMARAQSRGFTFRGPIRLYVETSFLFGSGFDTDPQYPSLAAPVHAAGDQMIRADRVYEAAVAYDRQVAGERAVNVDRALRRLLEAAREAGAFARLEEAAPEVFADRMLEAMRAFFPEKAAHLGDGALASLIAEAEDSAAQWGFTTPRQRALMAVLMFCFGHGCVDDALYPWIGRTLQDRRIVDVDARARRLERKALTWLVHVVAGNEAAAA